MKAAGWLVDWKTFIGSSQKAEEGYANFHLGFQFITDPNISVYLKTK